MKNHFTRPIPKGKRKYKDSLFRHLLTEDLMRLQELYHAVSGKDPGRIELPTLQEDAFFNEIRNDIVFLTETRLIVFFEHQSTWSDNLPLRFLWYLARCYREDVDPKAPYRKKRIYLRTPEFYLFYNGKEEMPERFTVRLSDSFLTPGGGAEIIVTVINVNYNEGFEIFRKSAVIAGYSRFTAKVRELEEQGLDRDRSIKNSIEWCIENDILSDYMKKYGRWVMEMMTFEYDAELAMAAAREDGYDDGFADGEAKGEARGEARGEGRLSRLMSLLLKSGKTDEATAAAGDDEIRQKLYKKYGIA